MKEYWKKQEHNKPLFPNILWSRPEAKHGSGKLAIIGGNAHAISAPGIAYSIAVESGSGVVKVLMPDVVRKTVKFLLPDAEYAPSNHSGSFAKLGMAEMISIANWSDCVLIAGDLGRNSETATLLENFIQKYSGPLVLTQDAADYFKETPRLVLNRPRTVLVISLAQLQRMYINIPLITPITYSMSLVQLIEALHSLTLEFPVVIVTKHNETIICAYKGKVTTSLNDSKVWRVKIATRAAVFYMQNENLPLESITSSLLPEI